MSGPRLMDEVRGVMRRMHYSIHTERGYCDWITQFVRFHKMQSREQLLAAEAPEVKRFLSHLAEDRNVAASTQNQAMNALVFLYKQVLGRSLEELGDFARAKRLKRLPVVLGRSEVARLLTGVEGRTQYLMAALLYGTGVRLMACVRMRVQDVDFHYHQIVVRNGKGQKDRVVPLPTRLEEPLQEQLREVRALHEQDLAQGYGEVFPLSCQRPVRARPRRLRTRQLHQHHRRL